MKKHGNTHKAPRSSKRQAPSHQAGDGGAQASSSDTGKINIGSGDDVMGVHDNDRDSGDRSLSGGSSGGRKSRRNDRAS